MLPATSWALLKQLEDEWRAGPARSLSDPRVTPTDTQQALAALESAEFVQRWNGAFRVTILGLYFLSLESSKTYLEEYHLAARLVEHVRQVLDSGTEAFFPVATLADALRASAEATTRALFRVGMSRGGSATFGLKTNFGD